MDQKVITKIGKYEIVAELGQGGMGVVYKARDPFIGRLVALKTITPELVSDPEILKRFYREAQSAGTLQHPNIVTIYDLGEADGHPYIAMEFVEGESLQNIINRRARIPLAAKLKLIQQFCEGLGHAHKHGFVHRDVKPANILVTNDGNVKVVDFGIVHLESTNLTKTGMFLGTIHYASPEQINDGRVDSRSDLWSVTCVAYEFIAYKKAFDGTNIAAIIAKVLSTEPEPLSRCIPGVPPELDHVITRGLKKSVDERYQSLDEMLGDILPIARTLQQSFIGDLITEAKELRGKGDLNGAQEKVRAILILDNTHGDAKRLHSEIAAELQRRAPVNKAKRLVAEAEQAFSRGEYAEAVRILGEAQELNPADTQARNLKDKALRELDRLREMRDAANAGQKAWKQGDLTAAEQEFHRVIQIDPNNSQASEYLEKIRQDRLARERDFRLKEALWQTDNLVSAGKYDEAQSRLLELLQDFPASDAVHQKMQALDPLIRSRKLFQEGEQAFNQSEYAEAVGALSEALELNPQNSEAKALRDKALQERDRLRQVREALSSGQRALRSGDDGAAEREFQKALQLDPTNTQATNLLGEIRQAQIARDRERRFREAVQRSDSLVANGKLDDAQQLLLELQQAFPDSSEIDQKLAALDQRMKVRRLLADGQHAFDQGEFGEAVRILTEAQDLDPANAGVRDLKVRAVQERDRLRRVREAINDGQRAMRQGDNRVAEREFKKALQLDPANAQATSLLDQIQKESQARERRKRLEEGLSQAENLIAAKKFDEAQRKLTELQKAFPDAEEVLLTQLTLTQRRTEAAATVAPPASADRAASPGTSLSDGAKSMQLAEELRRSLQRSPEAAPSTRPGVQPPVQTPPAGSMDGVPGATMMLRASLEAHPVGPPEALPPPGAPPLPQTPGMEPRKSFPVPPSARAIPKEEPRKLSPMILVAGGALAVILAISGYVIFHHRTPTTGSGTTQPEVSQSALQKAQEEKSLFDQAKAAQDAKKWDEAISLYNQVADLNGPLKDQALEAIPFLRQLRDGGGNIAKLEKDTFQEATRALQKKEYSQAQGFFQHVIDLKVPDSSLAPKAQDELAKLQPILQAQAEFDAAAGAQNRGDLQGALGQFQSIADKGGPFAAEAKTRIPRLKDMINNQGAQQEFNAALQLEKTDPKGALAKYQAIAAGSGPFKADAQSHIQQINDQFAAAEAQQQFDAANRAQSSGDLNGALAQFKVLAGKPGPMQNQAQQRVQQITDQLSTAADKQKFDAADRTQSSGDLKGALAQFKALADRPGPMQAQAQVREQQVAQLIADATKAPPTQAPAATPAARNPVVTLNQAGDCAPWTRPVQKGMLVPDYNVDGCPLKATNLSMGPVSGAPPNTYVLIKINIDENGNVTPDIVLSDNGMGPQVRQAARSWKFNPPTVKGKPVKTSTAVKVAF